MANFQLDVNGKPANAFIGLDAKQLAKEQFDLDRDETSFCTEFWWYDSAITDLVIGKLKMGKGKLLQDVDVWICMERHFEEWKTMIKESYQIYNRLVEKYMENPYG